MLRKARKSGDPGDTVGEMDFDTALRFIGVGLSKLTLIFEFKDKNNYDEDDGAEFVLAYERGKYE